MGYPNTPSLSQRAVDLSPLKKQIASEVGRDLTEEEATALLAAQGLDEKLMKSFDLNRDGELSKEELKIIKEVRHLNRPEDVIVQEKELVEQHIERKQNYRTAAIFILYFLLYVTILSIQTGM